MSDCSGFTLKRVRDVQKHTVYINMFIEMKKMSFMSKPSHLIYLDMH